VTAETGAKVPRTPISAVLSLRNRLNGRFKLFEDKTADRLHMQHLLDTICSASSAVQRCAVQETIRTLADAVLTSDLLQMLSAKIAGNVTELAAGKTVPIRAALAKSVIIPTILYISTATAVRNRFDEIVTQLRVDSITGDTAGQVFNWDITRGVARVLASRIGFSGITHNYPFVAPEQLSGLYVYVNLTGSDYSNDPAIKDVLEMDNIIQYNRKHVLKLRCRSGEQCPNKFTHPCHKCAMGRDRCPAATHLQTYVFATCNCCRVERSIVDPATNNGLCLDCDRNLRLNLKETASVV